MEQDTRDMEVNHEVDARPYLAGQWQLDRSEKYEEFLKEIGK